MKEKNNNYPTKKFPIIFGEQHEKFAEMAAKSIGCSIDYVKAGMLMSFTMMIGGNIRVKIKEIWTEGGVLFLVIIGEPGTKKTPALKIGLKPVYMLQEKLVKLFGEGFENRDIITTNSTIEALFALLLNNPHGILIVKDEFIGFVNSLGAYKNGKGDDMEQYLSLANQTMIKIDRKNSPKIVVERPFVSIVGAIQVDVLKDLMKMKNNGFIERLLFVYPEPLMPYHTMEEIPQELMRYYLSTAISIYNKSQNNKNLNLSLSKEARELWIKWNTEFCQKMNGEIPKYLIGFYSKMEGYTARFCLILEVVKCAENNTELKEISRESLEKAIQLTEYFTSNAEKVYNTGSSSNIDRSIEKACAWLIKQPHFMATLRKMYTNKVGGVRNYEEAYNLMSELRDRNCITIDRYEDGIGRGRVGYRIYLNRKMFAKETNYVPPAA